MKIVRTIRETESDMHGIIEIEKNQELKFEKANSWNVNKPLY